MRRLYRKRDGYPAMLGVSTMTRKLDVVLTGWTPLTVGKAEPAGVLVSPKPAGSPLAMLPLSQFAPPRVREREPLRGEGRNCPKR